MPPFSVFLSVVVVVRNQAGSLPDRLRELHAIVMPLAVHREIVIVDNASEDDSVAVLKQLCEADGLSDLQVYALTNEVDDDTATWVGIDNALGDFVLVADPRFDDVRFAGTMLDSAVSGRDLVFATTASASRRNLLHRAGHAVFSWLYRIFTGVRLARESPRFRLLSRRLVNYVQQHPSPATVYRNLWATAGFARATLTCADKGPARESRPLRQRIDRALQLLVSSTRAPMRLVASLCLFGAFANLGYSAYVIVVAILKRDVAPGWVTLSLQQSGMFFLISLVLLVLGEYVMQVSRLTSEGPAYHVAQEFTSQVLTARARLNVEVSGAHAGGSDPALASPRQA